MGYRYYFLCRLANAKLKPMSKYDKARLLVDAIEQGRRDCAKLREDAKLYQRIVGANWDWWNCPKEYATFLLFEKSPRQKLSRLSKKLLSRYRAVQKLKQSLQKLIQEL